MDERRRVSLFSVVLVVFLTAVMILSGLPTTVKAGGEEKLILRVGAQDDIKTRNVLAATDVWTDNVLAPVYEGVGQEDPKTEEPIPYLLKGIDADDSGTFDLDEYGVYKKESGTNPRIVTAYYDFNGVYFHDGVQATMDDLLFSYHLDALNPLVITLDVLMDKNNLPGSNFSATHWLWVYPANGAWDPAIPVGQNASLRFALHFEQQADYARFVKYTLNGASVYPRHIWEGTGKLCKQAQNGVCSQWETNIHDDFGTPYDAVKKNGVPSSSANAFDFDKALQWDPADKYVIGTGPFKFLEWTPGVAARLEKYDGYYADALDQNFARYMHQPYIDGMVFMIYKTPQTAVFALEAGDIDVVSWSIPPEFIADLQSDPNIGIVSTAEKGFFYLAYNMRKSPWGYPNNDPSLGDVGYWFRKAVAHVIDKKTIVTTLLQGYGVIADQPVNPESVRWYNGSVEKYDYDLEAAKAILDNHYTIGGYALGYGSSGYRNLPNIGDNQIQILTPQADYDPIRAAAGAMIAQRMRDVGINVVSTPTAFGEIVERLDNRDMDLWILGWRIGSDPPDYYHAFFYSGNAPSGQNYPGFQNDTFDALITQARAELDEDKQADLIKECSGLLADALPYDVLYFRKNIEAYRQDRFVNWTVGTAGSIFGGSFWSRIGIHAPPPESLKVSITVTSGVTSGGSLTVKATARDPEGKTLMGVPISISLSGVGNLGNLSIAGGEYGTTVVGTSDVSGLVIATYEAPEVTTEKEVFISAKAMAFGGYPESIQRTSMVVIHPPGVSFLAVTIDLPIGDILEEGNSMPVDIVVTDETQRPVEGANVTIISQPSGPTIQPDQGLTTAEGKLPSQVTFVAPVDIGGNQVTYVITVHTEKGDYVPADANKEVTAIKIGVGPGGGGTTTEVPSLGTLALISVIGATAVSYGLLRERRRRR